MRAATFSLMRWNFAGVQDGLVVRLDANGGVLWAQRVGGAGETSLSDVVVANGVAYVTGAFTESVDFGSGELTAPVGQHQGVIAGFWLDTGEPYDFGGPTPTFGGTDLDPRTHLALMANGQLAVVSGAQNAFAAIESGGVPILGPSNGPSAFLFVMDPGMGGVSSAEFLDPNLLFGGGPPMDLQPWAKKFRGVLAQGDGVVAMGWDFATQRLTNTLSPDWYVEADVTSYVQIFQGCSRPSDGMLAIPGILQGEMPYAGEFFTSDGSGASILAFRDADGDEVSAVEVDEARAQCCAFLAEDRVVVVGKEGVGVLPAP
jgi:hypothetical protein